MKLGTFRAAICSLALGAVITLTLTTPNWAAKRDKYTEIDVVDGATVSGRISFEGAIPVDAIEMIKITKNNDVCGDGDREVVWVDVKDGALRGAFVFIKKIEEGKSWSKPEYGEYLVVQKGCRFRPWAQVVRPGPIIIRNSDAGVLHNINAREMIGVKKGRIVMKTLFNFGQPEVGDLVDKIQPRRSSYIAINCEAHNFMFGFMLAPTHPYAVVVDDDGSYTIDDLPPGSYKLMAWHPRFGLQETKITVGANETIESNFTYSDSQ